MVSILIWAINMFPQNKNNAVLYGSNWSCALTIIASPSIERRRSVYPVAMYTCLSNARSFSITHVLMQAEYLLRYLQIIFLDTNIWVWSWNSYRYYCRFRFQTALPNFAKMIVIRLNIDPILSAVCCHGHIAFLLCFYLLCPFLQLYISLDISNSCRCFHFRIPPVSNLVRFTT